MRERKRMGMGRFRLQCKSYNDYTKRESGHEGKKGRGVAKDGVGGGFGWEGKGSSYSRESRMGGDGVTGGW
ncbi:hypothetical protein Ancab_014668 [Ancistrocladus abbreviatus]